MNITTENAGNKTCFFCGADGVTFKKASHKSKIGFRVTLCPDCAEEIYNLSFLGEEDELLKEQHETFERDFFNSLRY